MPLVTVFKKKNFGYRSCQNRNANASYLTFGHLDRHRTYTIKHPVNLLKSLDILAPLGPHYSVLYKHSFSACKRSGNSVRACEEWGYSWFIVGSNVLSVCALSKLLKSLDILAPRLSSACSKSTV